MRQRQLHLRICSDGKELPSNVSNFVQNECKKQRVSTILSKDKRTKRRKLEKD